MATTRGDRWRAAVLDEYDYTAAELELLAAAAGALDRLDAAEKSIESDGLLIDGLHGKKINPGVAIARDAEVSFLRFCRALGIVEKVSTDAAP